MWEAAGASIVSPPSNEIYNAFQTGVVTGTDTSLGTFASTRLYEVTDCLTAPGNNALWFMYEPVLMAKKNFDKLNKRQQDAIIKAGMDAQSYYEGKADAVNADAQRLTETLRTRKNRAISELEATGSAQRLERRLGDSEHDEERDRRRRDEIVGRCQVAAGDTDQPSRDEGREAAEHRHRDVVAD